jgi:hypothetical protein
VIGNEAELNRQLALTSRLQNEIWKTGVRACQASTSPLVMNLMLTSLNEMFDMATARNAAARIHPPLIIVATLMTLMLLCSFLAGYAMGGDRIRNYSHILGFVIILSAIFYVIMDLEYPRVGFLQIDSADAVIINQRKSMD